MRPEVDYQIQEFHKLPPLSHNKRDRQGHFLVLANLLLLRRTWVQRNLNETFIAAHMRVPYNSTITLQYCLSILVEPLE